MTSEEAQSNAAIAELIHEDLMLLDRPVFGPISVRRTQQTLRSHILRLNHVRALQDEEISNSNYEKKPNKSEKNSSQSHKFLMSKMKVAATAVDERSCESREVERAERAMFVQELMLATIQNQTSPL